MPPTRSNHSAAMNAALTPPENSRCNPSSASGKRSAVACRRCNRRKTRCTAGEGMPCTGCLNANVQCILIDSNRGKYARTKRGKPQRGFTEASASRKQAETSALEALREQPSHEEAALDVEEDEDAPESLYARIAQGVGRQPNNTIDAGKLVFLGEAFSLTYVVHDVLAPFVAPAPNYERRLHFHVNSRAAGRRVMDSQTIHRNRQRDFLEKQGLLHTLPPEVLGQLLETFFSSFHPAFPILDPARFTREAQIGEASLLVLNAVLLVAISICDEAILLAAGFQNQRYFGRAVFYHQAHALYNSDLEPDKISTLVGIFFMSFWWGGPDETKDSFHWLGVAANLAQALGLHRSTRNSGMDAATSKQWKRIWWAIRTRDTLVSGSIGRPQHIRGNDCDVEVLEESDVEEVLSGSQEERLYPCLMARLNGIFSKIITSRYSPVTALASDTSRLELENSLVQFRAAIPEGIQYRGVFPNGAGLWSAALNMAINYATILLCRPERGITGEEKTDIWGNTSMAVASANEVTRVIEDILSASLGRLSQIHTIPALFNALAMHIHAICTSSSIGGGIAENRARMCMLGLECLSDAWPVGSWVYRLFVSIWKRLEGRRGQRPARGTGTMGNRSTHNSVQQQHQPLESPRLSDPPSVETFGNITMSGSWEGAEQTGTFDPAIGLGGTDDVPHNLDPFQLRNLQHEMLMTHTIPDLFALNHRDSETQLDQGQFFDLLDIPQLHSYNGG